MLDTSEAGRQLVDFWNEIMVPKFVRFRHILVGGLAHHSAQVWPLIDAREGERVLDVGCGFGDTAIALAQRVGPAGCVLGVDCCARFLALARQDATSAGVSNLTFLEADAQTCTFEPEFDFVFSRFGTMFFASPVAGLRNLRSALKPGGRMTMIVWRSIDENSWVREAKETVLTFLPPPGEGGRNCGPGPFSMADRTTVKQQLRKAGFESVEFTRVDAPLVVGETPEEAVAFQLAIGPAGEVFREAGNLAERHRSTIEAALARGLARYVTDEGVVMPSSSWCISAKNPEHGREDYAS